MSFLSDPWLATFAIGAFAAALSAVCQHLIFGRCRHEHVRCIHGDEIVSTIRAWRKPTLARVRCTDCNKALYHREMSKFCWYTGSEH